MKDQTNANAFVERLKALPPKGYKYPKSAQARVREAARDQKKRYFRDQEARIREVPEEWRFIPVEGGGRVARPTGRPATDLMRLRLLEENERARKENVARAGRGEPYRDEYHRPAVAEGDDPRRHNIPVHPKVRAKLENRRTLIRIEGLRGVYDRPITPRS